MNHLRSILPFALATTLAAAPAFAQPSDADKLTAQALFDAAKQLATANKYEEACPKFAESQRLDPAIGTKFYLADCLEHLGRVATAWTYYMEVAAEARTTGQKDREAFARQRADALKVKLPRLSVEVSPEARKLEGLVVKRDGTVLTDVMMGVPTPVDPGTHVVSATAKGRKPWEQSISVKADGTTTKITVPSLPEEGAAPPPGPTPPAAAEPQAKGSRTAQPPADVAQHHDEKPSPGATRRTVGIVTLAVGGAGLVVGGIAGGLAIAKHGELAKSCPDRYCDPSLKGKLQGGIDSYEAMGVASTVGFVVGGAAAVTGVILIVTAPKAKAREGAVVPVVGPGYVGAAGRF